MKQFLVADVRKGLSASLQNAITDYEIEQLLGTKSASEVVDVLETVCRVDLSAIPSSVLWNELARRAVQAEFDETLRDVAEGDIEPEDAYKDLQAAADSLATEINVMATKVNNDDSYDFLPPVAYGTFISDAIVRVFPSKS